jgi:hypothetical protein
MVKEFKLLFEEIEMRIYICEQCKRNYYPSNRGLVHHFCSQKCYALSRIGIKRPEQSKRMRGKNNFNWKGGRRKDKDGYILIYIPQHPNCDINGYVREHRLVMEKKMGRYLKKNEISHHKNNIKDEMKIICIKCKKDYKIQIKIDKKKFKNFICMDCRPKIMKF